MAIILDGSGTTNFSTAVPCNPLRYSFPIPGDTTTQILEADFRQFQADWSAVALGTQYGSTGFYLVEETARVPVGGDVVQWTRIYCEIPAQRNEYESFGYQIPGMAGNTILLWKVITAASASGGEHTLTVASHGFAANDIIIVDYYVTDTVNSASYTRTVATKVNSVVDTNNFKIDQIIDVGTPSFRVARNRGTFRYPKTTVINSRLQHDYYLPGVSSGITTPADITLLSPTKIYDLLGSEVDTYSEVTSPTQSTYLSTTVGTEIVVQESVLARWRGTIHERVTRYAIAR